MKRPELKIERGVPLSHPNPYAGTVSATLCKLKVGESVLLPMYSSTEQLGSIRKNVQDKTGMRLTTRKVEGGIRVWRFA